MTWNFLPGYIYIYNFTLCLSVRPSVRPSVRVVDHALTAVLIDFIFGMNIDVIPGSDIGTLGISFFILKDHLWTKYLLCDVPYVQRTLIPYVQKSVKFYDI